MSIRPEPLTPIPDATAAAVRATFPKGNLYVDLRDEFGTFGNKIGVMSPPLYTNEPDPVKRLTLTHEAMKSLKEQHKALPASLMQDASEFIGTRQFTRFTPGKAGAAVRAREAEWRRAVDWRPPDVVDRDRLAPVQRVREAAFDRHLAKESPLLRHPVERDPCSRGGCRAASWR